MFVVIPCRRGVIVLLDDSLLTSDEVARMLDVSAKTVQNYAKDGTLVAESQPKGKRQVLRFRRETVEAFLQARKGDEG